VRNRANLRLRKNFRSKRKYFSSSVPPSIPRQASLGAGFLQQSLAEPSSIDGDLRKQYSSVWGANHQNAVAPSKDRIRRNPFRRRQYGNFDVQVRDFFGPYRRETGIVQGSIDRRADNSLSQRTWIFQLSYAAAKFAAAMERYEYASGNGELGGERRKIGNQAIHDGA